MVHHRSTAPGVRHQHTQQTPSTLPRPNWSCHAPSAATATQKPPSHRTHTAPAVPSLPSRDTMLGAVCVLLVLYPLEKRGCSRSRAGTQDCGACGTRARPRSGLRSWGGGGLRVRVGAAGHDEDMESLRALERQFRGQELNGGRGVQRHPV